MKKTEKLDPNKARREEIAKIPMAKKKPRLVIGKIGAEAADELIQTAKTPDDLVAKIIKTNDADVVHEFNRLRMKKTAKRDLGLLGAYKTLAREILVDIIDKKRGRFILCDSDLAKELLKKELVELETTLSRARQSKNLQTLKECYSVALVKYREGCGPGAPSGDYPSISVEMAKEIERESEMMVKRVSDKALAPARMFETTSSEEKRLVVEVLVRAVRDARNWQSIAEAAQAIIRVENEGETSNSETKESNSDTKTDLVNCDVELSD